MHSARPGITFRSGMSGWFHLGAVDPEDGRVLGQAARTELTLEFTVDIPDARAFMRERDETGELAATIDFMPLGRSLRSTGGTFNLQPRAAGGACTVAALECAFHVRGTAYYLSGRAEVEQEGHTDPWQRTTKARVTLHEGNGRHAPIVGAGVLTLRAEDLARLVSTTRVTGAQSLGDTELTLSGFGRFFLGEHWDAYARPPGAMRRAWRSLGRAARRVAGRR